jgi:hypothetical protein
MSKLEEYRNFDLCDLGFRVVFVFGFFLDFGLGEGVGLVGEDLEVCDLRAETKEGWTIVIGTASVMMSDDWAMGTVVFDGEVWSGEVFDGEVWLGE